MGWNPTKKLQPKALRRKGDPNSILMKHRRFLRGLEEAKTKEKEERDMEEENQQERVKTFKENAANQRKKIKELKREELLKQNDEEAVPDRQEER